MNCSFCGTCTGSDPFFYFADPVQKVSLSCSNLSKSVGKFPCYVAEGGGISVCRETNVIAPVLLFSVIVCQKVSTLW